MWPFARKSPAPVFFTNTLSGKKEEFSSLTSGKATIYSCGPTVYGPIHIGNLRSFVLSDLIARTLKESGYKVKRVMNITDVGHLVGDGDEGEDKMNVGAKKEATTPEQIAKRYTALFIEHIRALNFDIKEINFPRATGYIEEQIEMIRKLEHKGLAYKAGDGVYFDTAKFKDYGMLGNLAQVQLRAGARVEMIGDKRGIHDFALWRFAKENDLQQWDSPWGRGNPGWSIECSAMATTLLGPQIDIHTGGEDLAAIHHNNEIAQSEGASGVHPFVRTWVHGAFLNMDGEKISKSLGNTFSLDDVIAHGIDPEALRYFFLQSHYRSPLSFTWQSLAGSAEGLQRLRRVAENVRKQAGGAVKHGSVETVFMSHLRDDLATPAAVAYVWETLKNEGIRASERLGLAKLVERTLGITLLIKKGAQADSIPSEVKDLLQKREEARKNKDFAASDQLRIHIEERGYHVEDTASGPVLSKIKR